MGNLTFSVEMLRIAFLILISSNGYLFRYLPIKKGSERVQMQFIKELLDHLETRMQKSPDVQTMLLRRNSLPHESANELFLEDIPETRKDQLDNFNFSEKLQSAPPRPPPPPPPPQNEMNEHDHEENSLHDHWADHDHTHQHIDKSVNNEEHEETHEHNHTHTHFHDHNHIRRHKENHYHLAEYFYSGWRK